MIKNLLTHPLMRGRSLDAPQTTQIRKKLIRQKKFLEKIYQEWYGLIRTESGFNEGIVLELGSGAGFLNEFFPNLVKTEVFYLSEMDAILDAGKLPFKKGSLPAIVMSDVFHHLPRPRDFLHEVLRVLPKGGRVVMVEPWVSRWSRWVYPHLHHEPFDPQAKKWEFPSTGPLSGSNQALPWIVFKRDRVLFANEFPKLSIKKIQPLMPLRYLLSGGVSLRSFMPGWSFGFWKWSEKIIARDSESWAMFALIVLEKVNE
jgi:SAM-dependent methyltransferase